MLLQHYFLLRLVISLRIASVRVFGTKKPSREANSGYIMDQAVSTLTIHDPAANP